MHFLDVGNHRHLAPLGLQVVQGIHRQLQGFRVEAAEAFVDEQRLDAQLARCHRGQAERQGQGNQEGLAAGERIHRAQFVAHLGVHHQQAQFAAAALQAVAPRQLAQLHVAVLHQQVEVVALGDAAELVAAGRTDQFVQAAPSAELGAGSLQFGKQRLALLAALVVGLQLAVGLQVGLFAGGQAFALLPQVVFQRLAVGFRPLPAMLEQLRLALCFQRLLAGDLLLQSLQLLPPLRRLFLGKAEQGVEAAVVEVVLAFAPGLPVGLKALELILLALPLLLQVFQGFGESQLFLAQRIQGRLERLDGALRRLRGVFQR